MLKNQVISFGHIGASLTIIVAFLMNYICGLIAEKVVFGDHPNVQEIIGCVFIFVGIFIYRRQLVDNSQKEAQAPPENLDTNVRE